MQPQPKPTEIPAVRVPRADVSKGLHRIFDVVCAAGGLVLLSPLFLLIAVAITVDDRGPIFYRQTRVGKGFHTFQLCKFRTMVQGADRMGLLTASKDPRLTRLGHWLRQNKLDELPQLFNVLNGEMQLVGSRPEVERYVEMFRPAYADLLQDRPGITDPAALAYRHEESLLATGTIEKQYVDQILPVKLRLSLNYQRRRTFWSDVRILLQTLFGMSL